MTEEHRHDLDSNDAMELESALSSFLDANPSVDPDSLPKWIQEHDLGPGRLFGNFLLEHELGTGGMGVVFKARPIAEPQSPIALKILRSLFPSAKAKARFKREVAIIRSLNHPAIVPILDGGVEGFVAYATMKFIDGIPGSRLLRKSRDLVASDASCDLLKVFRREFPDAEIAGIPSVEDKDANFQWIAQLVLQLANALQHAHENQVVHRDVKPSNIIVTPTGLPVLIDFGLASLQADETLTTSGDFLGTLSYASPEQIRGEKVDIRTDVYSLGATLYELLSLSRPFDEPNETDLRNAILNHNPSPLDRSIPPSLRTICGKALSKSTANRYPTPGALANDLRNFRAGRAILARPPGIWKQTRSMAKRHPRVSIALALLASLCVFLEVRAQILAHAATGRAAVRLDAVLEKIESLNTNLEEIRRRRSAEVPMKNHDRANLEGLVARTDKLFQGIRIALDGAAREARTAFGHVKNFTRAQRLHARVHAERLRLHLGLFDDLLNPPSIRGFSDSLRIIDRAGEHTNLVDPIGQVTLFAHPPDVGLKIFEIDLVSGTNPRDGRIIATSQAPLTIRLEEGPYLAVATSPGYAESLYPFFVRRDSTRTTAHAFPPSVLEIELIPSNELQPGFKFVPGGWTLVLDNPPYFVRVPSFQMRTHELTTRDWLEVVRRVAPDRIEELIPAIGEEKLFLTTDVGIVPAPWVDLDWPVRGIAQQAIDPHPVQELLAPECENWFLSLPTRAEWIRAARGADARRFPWGDMFSWDRCAGYPSQRPDFREQRPYPIGQFSLDVSPFGIFDLAGSVREFTQDSSGPLRGIYLARGGSFKCYESRQMTTTSRMEVTNGAQEDVGFRFVLRRLPDWHRSEAPTNREFRDDFEAEFETDVGAAIGAGWVQKPVDPFEIQSSYYSNETCFVRDGRLVLRGGTENFSNSEHMFRKILLSKEGFRIQTVLSSLSASRENPGARGFRIQIRRGVLRKNRYVLSTIFGLDGATHVVYMHPGGIAFSPHAMWHPNIDEGSERQTEIRLAPPVLEIRAWGRDGVRPDEPVTQLILDPFPPDFHFLELSVHNFAGVHAEIDEISVE